jgi:hypothetical protein
MSSLVNLTQLNLPEGDEEAFVLYEEQVIYQLQRLWHQKEGLEMKPVMELSAKLEDLIYQQTLKNFSLSNTANIWAKKECIQSYQEMTQKLVNHLETKTLNWKKMFDDHEKVPQHILKQLMKNDDGRKAKINVNKAPKVQKEPKLAKGPPKVKEGGKPVKKKKDILTTLSAADEINPFAAESEPFDDSLFDTGGGMGLLEEDGDVDLFKFESTDGFDDNAWMS